MFYNPYDLFQNPTITDKRSLNIQVSLVNIAKQYAQIRSVYDHYSSENHIL
jgi:hypothetical protein